VFLNDSLTVEGKGKEKKKKRPPPLINEVKENPEEKEKKRCSRLEKRGEKKSSFSPTSLGKGGKKKKEKGFLVQRKREGERLEFLPFARPAPKRGGKKEKKRTTSGLKL